MANDNELESVAVIGLGNMGSALAEALLAHGYPVSIWNRTAAKAESLVQRGALLASDPAAAAHDSQRVIVCLADHEACVSVIHTDSVAEALEGKQLLQLGVITAEQSRQTGAWAADNNIDYLEASILGIPKNVRSATATLICSGPRSLYDDCRATLSVFGNSHLVSEAAGSAYDFDKVYFSFAYACLLGYVQGAAMATASGLSIDAYSSIVVERLPKIGLAFEGYNEQMRQRDHRGDQASLRAWADGYAKSLDLCRDLGVDDSLPAALMRNMDKAIDAGYEDQEITAILEVLLPEG